MSEKAMTTARARLAEDPALRERVAQGDWHDLADLDLEEEEQALITAGLDEFADEVSGFAIFRPAITSVSKLPGPPAPFVPTPLPNLRRP